MADMWKRILAAAVIAGALVGLLIYSQHRPPPSKVSVFIESDQIRPGSHVGGRVVKVLVQEGDRVEANKVLVELDPYNLRELRAQADGQLKAREAELQKLRNGPRPEEIAQAKARRDELEQKLKALEAGPRKETKDASKARLEAAAAEREYAASSLEKTKAQYESRSASKDELDRAGQALKTAQAMEQMRRAELAELEAGTRVEDIEVAKAQLAQAEQAWALLKNGSRKEDIASAEAARDAAKAALDVIDRQVDELSILAPGDGIIEACNLKPGDLVGANAPALSMVEPNNLWVRAFVPEDFPQLQIGRKVRVTVDSFPGRTFVGRISFVARQAEFTPNNVQTPDKRSEQVFRIKVALDEGQDILRAGMPVDVWLD
jgi:multidrug resistance efflux pump